MVEHAPKAMRFSKETVKKFKVIFSESKAPFAVDHNDDLKLCSGEVYPFICAPVQTNFKLFYSLL